MDVLDLSSSKKFKGLRISSPGQFHRVLQVVKTSKAVKV